MPSIVRWPGHVRAGMNWNTMRRMNSDNYSMQIVDGMKAIVCKLRPNALGWTSIAYPTDELHLPQWFRELPFADAEMEATVVDQKSTICSVCWTGIWCRPPTPKTPSKICLISNETA